VYGLKRGNGGFTLVELFVITLIIAFLAFAVWRYFEKKNDIQRKNGMQQQIEVEKNMRMAQTAAQAYFNDSGGTYPKTNDDPGYLSYFPGGSRDNKGSRIGNLPLNPFTRLPEAPKPGKVTDVAQTRLEPPKLIGEPGQILYSPVSQTADGKEVTSYAIQGADKDGRSLGGANQGSSLVLSNQ